jgi:hypothetical protein
MRLGQYCKRYISADPQSNEYKKVQSINPLQDPFSAEGAENCQIAADILTGFIFWSCSFEPDIDASSEETYSAASTIAFTHELLA